MDRNCMDGNRALAFLKEFDYIREAGTPAEEQAAARIAQEIRSLGLVPKTEEFVFHENCITEVYFQVTEPEKKEYRVSGFKNSGNTPAEGIEVPFYYAENGDDVNLSFAEGKIVMVNAPMRAELYRKLVKAGAAAFLVVSGTPVDEGEDRTVPTCRLRGLTPEETAIQGAGIHCRDAQELVEKGAGRARLVVRQEEREKISRNVRVRIPGTDEKLKKEILTLTAHYDSVPEGPGAYDNMAGAAIIMELLRWFAEHPPLRTLEFVWFGAEEKGLEGSLAYVERHSGELENHRFNMNVDLAGQLIGGTVIGVTADTSVCAMLSLLVHESGIGASFKNQIWGSDSNTFAWKGIPAMTLNRDGYGMHTRYDTAALISPWSLQRSSLLLGHLAERLADIPVFPFERTMPEQLLKELDAFFA